MTHQGILIAGGYGVVGHLWYSLLGFKGNPHWNPIPILSNVGIAAGFILLSSREPGTMSFGDVGANLWVGEGSHRTQSSAVQPIVRT